MKNSRQRLLTMPLSSFSKCSLLLSTRHPNLSLFQVFHVQFNEARRGSNEPRHSVMSSVAKVLHVFHCFHLHALVTISSQYWWVIKPFFRIRPNSIPNPRVITICYGLETEGYICHWSSSSQTYLGVWLFQTQTLLLIDLADLTMIILKHIFTLAENRSWPLCLL